MTANKRTVAGAAAAIVVVAAAGLLAINRQQGSGSPAAPERGPSTAAPAVVVAGAATHAAADRKPGTGHAAAKKANEKSGEKSGDKGGDKPLWHSLTAAQQQALQPLQGEWDEIDSLRKQKWLQLANRFAAMPPQEQQRVQQRMREWARLTPAQRELARETYNRARKIAPQDKNASWESYQQLSPDQKRKLAATAAARKTPPVVPSQANGKIVTPLGPGAGSCPAGMTKNTVSAAPACVAAPPSTSPRQPNPPTNPAPQQDKQVPANWGITPSDA